MTMDYAKVLDENRGEIRRKMINIARRRGVAYYGDFFKPYGLDMSVDYHRDVIVPNFLADICREEHEENRPLLSVVIYRKDANRPGDGFFDLAAELLDTDEISGKSKPDDKLAFAAGQLQIVHDYWVNHPAG